MGLIKFTEEERLFQASVQQFVEKEIRPYALEWEDAGRTPRELWKKCGDQGFLGISSPEEWGGMGADYRYTFIWTVEIAKCGSSGVAMGLTIPYMATPALQQFGTPEQKKAYLRPALKGDYICAVGVTEPGCGSDVAAIQTKALRQGNHYVINGRKMFITNGMQADFITLLARTSDAPGHHSFSLFVVPTNLKGVQRGRELKKTCYQSSDTAEIILDNVQVPVENLIGREGQGFIYQMAQFQYERLIAIALCLGGMQRSYALTKRYINERSAFGKTLAQLQVTRHKMAQILSEITLIESMSYHCVDRLREGQDLTKEISMLKLTAAQIQSRVLDECVQLHGGYGLMVEYEISRYLRDSKLMAIGGGTNEVMKEIIAKMELG